MLLENEIIHESDINDKKLDHEHLGQDLNEVRLLCCRDDPRVDDSKDIISW
jgi:hypothetical protein